MTATISSGVTSSYSSAVTELTVAAGGTVDVLTGGDTSWFIVDGVEVVSSGGSAVATTVQSGGVEVISSGGSATLTWVDGGGLLVVSSGGSTTSTAIYAGGILELLNGSTEVATTVAAGGTIEFGGGYEGAYGIANSVTLLVESAATDSGSIIAAGGKEFVFAGGMASATAIAGRQVVLGRAVDDTVENGGVLVVSSGGVASASVVSSGGLIIVSSGGLASGSVVSSGGVFELLRGGEKLATTVLAGGTIAFGSGYEGTYVLGDLATLLVEAGATDDGSTIGAGGSETIAAGGYSELTEITGTRTLYGSATNDTIEAGGLEVVASGGNASWTMVDRGGNEVVSSGGVTSDTMINDAMVDLQSGAAAIGSLTFTGVGGTLQIDGTVLPSDSTTIIGAVVSGFSIGDEIDLTGISYDSNGSVTMLSGNTLEIVENGPTYDLAFDPTQDFTGYFHLVADGDGTAIIENNTPCFVHGTLILTPAGAVPVEALRPGDLVRTASGASRPVRWVGRRALDLARAPVVDRMRPVRIAPRAFNTGTPFRPLFLSPDHAVLIDGMLVPIRLLVNGGSIAWDTERRGVIYYHVELDHHDILLAEGLATESYLDTGNRCAFENAGLPIRLHPDFAGDQRRREAESCWPFVDDAQRVEPLWVRLAARSVVLGMSLPPWPEATGDPALHLGIDGRVIRQLAFRNDTYTFLVPRNTLAFHLLSRRAFPADTKPWISDRRRLGVMVAGLRFFIDRQVVDVPLDHPALGPGWWAPEWHGPALLRRWTGGAARIPVPECSGAPVLFEVTLAQTLTYPHVARSGTAMPRRHAG